MGVQCKPAGKLKSIHTKMENKLIKEKMEAKTSKGDKEKKK